MLESFSIAFRLRNTYKANSFIYIFKSIPLIKKLLPGSLYANEGLKIFANILAIIFELTSIFAGKALYLVLIFFVSTMLNDAAPANTFIHTFFFLTLVGGLLNTQLFNPTKDKYYALFLMRMDARAYTLSNYLYFLLKMLVGFVPFTLLFGLMTSVPLAVCLVMPFFVCGVKLIVAAVTLYDCRDGQKVRNENLPSAIVWTGTALFALAAFLLPALGFAINHTVFLVVSAIAIVAGLCCLIYVWRFQNYRAVYRTLLTPGNMVMNTTHTTQIVQQSNLKKIQVDVSQTSNKSGYAYFNELFMKRHSRILTKTAKKIALASALLLAAAGVAGQIIPDINVKINDLLLHYFPFSLLLMYFINRGRTITQAMFMNCDHSMLTYRIYRQPKAILSLFTARLKDVVAINLLPAAMIGIGCGLLLFFSGGTENPVNYVILPAVVLMMSVFFSVHTLVLYYLLQPYNVQLENKNALYTIADLVTYYICFFAAGKALPILTFGIAVTAFCLFYVVVSLLLAYRLAPKTFKLRA